MLGDQLLAEAVINKPIQFAIQGGIRRFQGIQHFAPALQGGGCPDGKLGGILRYLAPQFPLDGYRG